MKKTDRERIVRTYFDMWTERNFKLLNEIFDPEIYYSECYGPEYQGLTEIQLWVEEMLSKQRVLEWSIKQFIHQDNRLVAEWFFKDETNGKINCFDGVSIIEFQDLNIISIKEFFSEPNHIHPYRNV